MNDSLYFSVIICSRDALKFAQASNCFDTLLDETPHEIIGIHDARSLAEGYNRGLAQSNGDIIIFSHDDVLIIAPDFTRKVIERMQTYDVLGFAGSRRLVSSHWTDAGYPFLAGAIAILTDELARFDVWNNESPVTREIQALDGFCMITQRETALEIGFDERNFDGVSMADLDFSFRAWLAGKRLGVCCDIPVFHDTNGTREADTRAAAAFEKKHQEKLQAAPVARIGGRSSEFIDHRALLAAWRPATLEKVRIALQRQHDRHEEGDHAAA